MTTRTADVAIIGGGLLGCACALYLAREGVEVVVIERRGLCMEASGVNSGFISVIWNRPYLVPYAMRGRELWERSAEWLGMDMGFRRRGGFKLAFTDEEAQLLEAWMDEAKGAGAPVELLSAGRAREIEPALSDNLVLAAYSPIDGFANSNLTGLAFRRALMGAGVGVAEGTSVTNIARDGSRWRVETSGEAVQARTLVVAAGVWIEDIAAMLGVPLPITTRKSQVVVTERMAPVLSSMVGVARGVLSVKQAENGTVIVGGGWQGLGDRERGGTRIIPENLIGNLRLAHHAVPGLAGTRVVRAWLGLEARTADNVPLIGPLPGVEDVLVIGAIDSGYMIGPFAARVLADLYLGREADLPAFDPARLFAPAA